jgi:hypothetical protein
MKKIIKLKNNNGELFFESNNNGIIINMNEYRTDIIDINHLIKNKKPVYKSMFIVKNNLLISLFRLENENIDAIYINKNNKSIICIEDNSEVFWDGKILLL